MEYFRRIEQKYILTKKEFDIVTKEIKKYVDQDKYYRSSICSVYFDSDNNDLIINSIDGSIFKEKIRIRSYGLVNNNDKIFLELKKKFKGVTYKKRVTMTLKEFWNYYDNRVIPESCKNLSMKEIDYCFNKYDLSPKMFIHYDRYSYVDKSDKSIRITFDYNLKYRNKNLNLYNDDDLKKIVDEDIYVMEIKTTDRIPLWFTNILSKLKLYPGNFSKYKEAYLNTLCL